MAAIIDRNHERDIATFRVTEDQLIGSDDARINFLLVMADPQRAGLKHFFFKRGACNMRFPERLNYMVCCNPDQAGIKNAK
jgi:hypothetical protein